MKKTAVILMTALIFAGMFALSACSLLPRYGFPARTEIGGRTFVSGFYEDLWPVGIVFGEDDPPTFETEYYLWWKVEGGPFELYCAQNKEALYWNPAVYCREDEFEEVKNYYADAGHFDYFIGLYGDSGGDSRIRLGDDADRILLEKAVSLNMRIEADSGKGVFGEKLDWSDRKVLIPFEERAAVQPVLYRMSRDGFFTTVQNDWIVADGSVYIFGGYDGETDCYEACRIDGETDRYLMELFQKYGLM